jgi:hypothetical protein
MADPLYPPLSTMAPTPSYWDRAKAMLTGSGPINTPSGVTITPEDIQKGMNLGMSFSGGGLGIKAYHGSPHDFDAFDMSKIGTGEGAQAYGHGLYFAENEGTAKGYREKLSGQPILEGGVDPFKDMPWLSSEQKGLMKWQLNEAEKQGLTGDEAVQYAGKKLSDMGTNGNPHMRQVYYDASNAVFDLRGKKWGTSPGRMYEVDINADPSHFLDWDKPLSQQPQAVQDLYNARIAPGLKTREIGSNPNFGAMTDVIHPDGGSLGVFTSEKLPDVLQNPSKYVPTKGEDFYSKLANDAWDRTGGRSMQTDAAASQVLRDAGIPGIKYLDQGSRAAGEGSRNYVVFNDKLIDIVKKYGLAGLLGSGILETDNNRQ